MTENKVSHKFAAGKKVMVLTRTNAPDETRVVVNGKTSLKIRKGSKNNVCEL